MKNGDLVQFKPSSDIDWSLWYTPAKQIKKYTDMDDLKEQICSGKCEYHKPPDLVGHIAECIDVDQEIFYFVAEKLYAIMPPDWFTKLKN